MLHHHERPHVWHRIVYNRNTGIVNWRLDGTLVYSVNTIGRRLARQYMVIDHGGVEQTVSMRQLNCGMGMFTLLDASMSGGAGLARLSSAAGFYFQPAVGTSALSFVDNVSQPGSRLFGQGASFTVGAYSVARNPVLVTSPPEECTTYSSGGISKPYCTVQ